MLNLCLDNDHKIVFILINLSGGAYSYLGHCNSLEP